LHSFREGYFLAETRNFLELSLGVYGSAPLSLLRSSPIKKKELFKEEGALSELFRISE